MSSTKDKRMEYKIIIFGQGLYKELPLKSEFANGVFMGTGQDAQLRFIAEKFGVDFWIRVEKAEERYRFTSSSSVCMHMDDTKGETILSLAPGETLRVYQSQSGEELFCINLSLDFGNENTDFNKRISCAQVSEFSFGGSPDCEIRIYSKSIDQDKIRLRKREDGYEINTESCRYGIYINGCQIQEHTVQVQNHDFVALNGCQFYIEGEWLYVSENMALDTAFYVETVYSAKNHFRYPKFVRSVRQMYEIPQEKPEILQPSQLPQEPQTNLVMTIVPLLASLALTVIMRSTMGRGGVFILYSVGTMALSGAMSLWNYKNQGATYREQCKRRNEVYGKYLQEQEVLLQELRAKERAIACQRNTVLEEQLGFVEDFDSRLFEKQRGDSDFLSCYLGLGTLESQCQVQYKETECFDTEDPLMDCPKTMHDKYQYIDDMPVMLELGAHNAIGFVGDRGKLYQMAKNITLSLAATHFYKDVKFFYILDEADQTYFAWARWLQNTINDELEIRNFIFDEKSRKVLLEYLYSELSRREGMDAKIIASEEVHYVVFVYRSQCISTHPISDFIEKAQQLGFTFLFFEEYAEFLHKDCSTRIFLENGTNEGYVQSVEDGEKVQRFYYPHIPVQNAAAAALRLGCVYVDEVSLEGSLTKNITLYQLLRIRNAEDLRLGERWEQSKIYNTMAAPLGVKSGNEIVCLDLHEKFHGPHGLVAGTTGSGKSEILQTYILSMATLFHPYEVGFIIIDFKGGGMVNQFKDLPHLNGAITNIDGREIDRSLASIRAELRKRQELFAEYEVNHIDDYIKLFKTGKTQRPLPHLILIVDEFAELKSEQPEFMKELISAARIGRSLGVHLILATQKPAGVVNDQIWSNSKFKLCLKVQTKEDSNEVLKSPLAAEIREPGRAYLQVGNNEIFQLFQSAYSGASANSENMGDTKAFRISKVNLAGGRTVIYEQKPPKNTSAVSQLDALVEYISNYCRQRKIQKLPNICLPSLEYVIPYTIGEDVQDGADIQVPIGYYDDPSRQLQAVTGVDFTQNHIYIVGSSQYGKTNLLQCMVRGIAEKYSPDDVNIYVLDFASMIMKNFEPLKCVGGVVTAREDERLKALMKMLVEEIERRKDLLAGLGLSSFAAYREGGYRELPQIVLMIDNIGAVKELYPKYEENLLAICRDGVAVGISMVVTTVQASVMGYRFLSNFGKRIALYCNESSEYGHTFERCKLRPDNKPGRCLLELDREMFEGQIYLAFAAEREVDKIAQIRDFIKEINTKTTGKGARKIPEIPAVVTEKFIEQQTGGVWKPYEMVSGVNYTTTELEYLKLLQTAVIGVAAREQETSDKFLRYLLQTLLRRREQEPVQIYIADHITKGLEKFRQYEDCVDYSFAAETSLSYIHTVAAILDERYQQMVSGEEAALETQPLQVIVLNTPDCYPLLSNDAASLELYKQMIGKYRTMKFVVIMAQLPNAGLNFGAAPVIKASRDIMNLFLFYNLNEQKLIDIPLAVQREYSKPIDATDAFNIYAGNLEKVKTPVCAE